MAVWSRSDGRLGSKRWTLGPETTGIWSTKLANSGRCCGGAGGNLESLPQGLTDPDVGTYAVDVRSWFGW
jgi:hypothetical protein